MCRNLCVEVMGGDLGGTGGTVPQHFLVGDGPCIRPPNILRSRPTVNGYEANHELTKKRCQGGTFCCEIEVFGQEGYICYKSEFQTVEADKRQKKIESMTEKGQKLWVVKWTFLRKKVIRKSGPSPQTWRQVSAHGFLK